jgi:hypothetical protein
MWGRNLLGSSAYLKTGAACCAPTGSNEEFEWPQKAQKTQKN